MLQLTNGGLGVDKLRTLIGADISRQRPSTALRLGVGRVSLFLLN